jgi:hypothetical protein
MINNIFISYRREGGAELARLVYNSLREYGYNPFMDIEDLKSGKFNTALYKKIEESTDMVVILTPGCLERCSNIEDWFRQEINHAIKCNINIIPVMGRGFQMPSFHDLPQDIATLTEYQGVTPSHNLWEASMMQLFKLLKSQPVSNVENFKEKIPASKLIEKRQKNIKTRKKYLIFFFIIIAIVGVSSIIIKNYESEKKGGISLGERYSQLVELGYLLSAIQIAHINLDDPKYDVQKNDIERIIKKLDLKIPKESTGAEMAVYFKNAVNTEYEQICLGIGVYMGVIETAYFAMKSEKITASGIEEARDRLTQSINILQQDLIAMGILNKLEQNEHSKILLNELNHLEKVQNPDFDLILQAIKSQLILSFSNNN